MHLFDRDGKMKKYSNVYDIIDEYFDVRLEYYDRRKEYLLGELNKKKQWFDNVIRFINLVIGGKIIINNKKLEEIKLSLENHKFHKIDGSFSYLLNIPIYKFSKEELDGLNNGYNTLVGEIKDLEGKDNRRLWNDDLVELRKEIKRFRK